MFKTCISQPVDKIYWLELKQALFSSSVFPSVPGNTHNLRERNFSQVFSAAEFEMMLKC